MRAYFLAGVKTFEYLFDTRTYTDKVIYWLEGGGTCGVGWGSGEKRKIDDKLACNKFDAWVNRDGHIVYIVNIFIEFAIGLTVTLQANSSLGIFFPLPFPSIHFFFKFDRNFIIISKRCFPRNNSRICSRFLNGFLKIIAWEN